MLLLWENLHQERESICQDLAPQPPSFFTTPLAMILLYHLGNVLSELSQGPIQSQTAGNSLSSCASIPTNPVRSGEVDSWKASLVAVPFLCHCLHVGRERQ